MKQRIVPVGILLAFVIAILSYGFYVFNEREQERQAIPVKASLQVYTDLPNSISSLLAEAYEAKYHVRITMLPLTEEQLSKRMEATQILDDQNGDLVITNREILNRGVNANKFQPIVIEESDAVLDSFKNLEYLWVGLWYDPIVIAQSNEFFKREGRFITTWHTLALDGDWRIIMTDFVAAQSAANILYSFVEVYGEEAALKYFERLRPHVVQYSKFLVTPIRLAALGETDIGLGNYSDGMQYVSHNYPVTLLFPADGTPYYLVGAGILKSSKNTTESIQFLKWLLHKDLAKLMADNGYYYIYTNPELEGPMDSMQRKVVLLGTSGDYNDEGKKVLLNKWINQVRFRKVKE